MATAADHAMWSEQDTTPSAVDAALRGLLTERHAEDRSFVPARVLNLVAVVDRDWRGEIYNRLERVGRFHPSRTILCAVEPGRETIDAWVTVTAERDPGPGEIALTHERVVLDVGPHHLPAIDTIVDPLVVTDLATLCWAPHGHAEAIDALLRMAPVVLDTAINEPYPQPAVRRAHQLVQEAYVVDLAWLRSTPWRERVAATFDPAQWREELGRITSVTVKHRDDSRSAGLLFLGWLATRLGWQPESMLTQDGALVGNASGRKQHVSLRLQPEPDMSAPGLAGVSIETASGVCIALDRGSGGLTARRRFGDGTDSTWTVMGASRGEAGILGEGIRQALLRDRAYGRALSPAERLLP